MYIADVFVSGIYNQNLTLQVPLNFNSFTNFLYKFSLNKYLIDRSIKICNNWNSFQSLRNITKSQKTLNLTLMKMHIDHF